MLVELSVVEQRYHAVMGVAAGVPVTQAFGRQPDCCLRPGTHLVCMADDSPARIVPKPLGAADTLLEAGEEPSDLSSSRSPGCTAGQASILIRTERWRLGGEGCRPTPRVTPWGATRGRWSAKETEAHIL